MLNYSDACSKVNYRALADFEENVINVAANVYWQAITTN